MVDHRQGSKHHQQYEHRSGLKERDSPLLVVKLPKHSDVCGHDHRQYRQRVNRRDCGEQRPIVNGIQGHEENHIEAVATKRVADRQIEGPHANCRDRGDKLWQRGGDGYECSAHKRLAKPRFLSQLIGHNGQMRPGHEERDGGGGKDQPWQGKALP